MDLSADVDDGSAKSTIEGCWQGMASGIKMVDGVPDSGGGEDWGYADDNWSVSSMIYADPWLFDGQAEVGVLLEDFYEASGHLLGRYGIATVAVEPESLKVISCSGRAIGDLKVLVIPGGGLRDLGNKPLFWQRLEEYVLGGGYLVVLDQPYGEFYSRLPGSPQARGWEEDLSCTGYTTKLNDGHPAASGHKYKVTNYPTDGFFIWLPPGAQTHAIRLRRGGAASAITYPYGQGRVFATTCYMDQAYGQGQWTADAGKLLRDAISCGLFPEWTFEIRDYQSFIQKYTKGEALKNCWNCQGIRV